MEGPFLGGATLKKSGLLLFKPLVCTCISSDFKKGSPCGAFFVVMMISAGLPLGTLIWMLLEMLFRVMLFWGLGGGMCLLRLSSSTMFVKGLCCWVALLRFVMPKKIVANKPMCLPLNNGEVFMMHNLQNQILLACILLFFNVFATGMALINVHGFDMFLSQVAVFSSITALPHITSILFYFVFVYWKMIYQFFWVAKNLEAIVALSVDFFHHMDFFMFGSSPGEPIAVVTIRTGKIVLFLFLVVIV